MMCELCGKKFDPDEDITDLNGYARLPVFLDKNYCHDCKKVMVIKYKEEENDE